MRAIAVASLTLVFVLAFVAVLIVAKLPHSIGCASIVEFEPQDDITPIELAIIVSHTQGFNGGRVICVTADKPIPPALMRHFKTLRAEPGGKS
jgi:hypothetical protein